MPSREDDLALDELPRALAKADVKKPTIPMAAFVQQAYDLIAFLEQHADVKQRLLDVGLPPDVWAALPAAIDAVKAAESAWRAVFPSRRPQELSALEETGARLRSDVVAAARWNLRKDRAAQATLDHILRGSGPADLAQDLGALAAFVDLHASAFEQDRSFDASERARECRRHAEELRDITSALRADLARPEAKDRRDRAYTWADHLLSQTREAGRYAFRDAPEVLERFQDRYRVQAVRKSRRRVKS